MSIQKVQLMFLENECDVEFDYSPAIPGRMYMRNGDPGYPAEPEEFVITSIVAHYGKNERMEILGLLSEQAIEDAEEAVREIWKDDYKGEPDYAVNNWRTAV